MIFVNYLSPRFLNVADGVNDMFTATTTTFIKAVNVCNKSTENIRINLSVQVPVGDASRRYFIIKDRIIKPNSSENILAEGSLGEMLQPSESLQCFSNGYSQIFDCSFYLEELTETLKAGGVLC